MVTNRTTLGSRRRRLDVGVTRGTPTTSAAARRKANEDAGRHRHPGTDETTLHEDVRHGVRDECPVKPRSPANNGSVADRRHEGEDAEAVAGGCRCTRPDEIRCTGGGLDKVPDFGADERIFSALYMVKQDVSELRQSAFGDLKVSGRVLILM
jgi:hypothetical protein